MKRNTVVALSVMLVFAFVISLASPGFAEQKKMQSIEGKTICVEADKQGNLITSEKSECKNGIFVVLGKDKIYTLYGSEEQMKKMAMRVKEKEVRGEVQGSQRGWILYASPIEKGQKPVEKTVEGTIVCLLPNYENGTVTPVVASGPCNELTPHAHIIYTKEGQIIAIHGSGEAIQKLEMNPQKRDVMVKGRLQGNPGAWILFVE
jgi:hypothetical protein